MCERVRCKSNTPILCASGLKGHCRRWTRRWQWSPLRGSGVFSAKGPKPEVNASQMCLGPEGPWTSCVSNSISLVLVRSCADAFLAIHCQSLVQELGHFAQGFNLSATLCINITQLKMKGQRKYYYFLQVLYSSKESSLLGTQKEAAHPRNHIFDS